MATLTLLGKQGKNPCIWYDVNGYVVTISELARLFGVNHNTLRQRVRYGWNIAAACIVDSTSKLSFSQVAELMADPAVETKFEAALRAHFNRPSTLNFKV